MSLSWPFATGREDFGVLHVVVNARSQSPTDVISSLKLVKDAVPATKGLLTGFRLIPQGKKLVAMADEFVASRQETMKFVNEIDEVKSKAATFRTTVNALKVEDSVKHALELLATVRALRQQKGWKEEGSQLAMNNALEELKGLCKDIVNQHVIAEATPWVLSQAETLKASRIISKPPAYNVLQLASEFKAIYNEDYQTLVDLSAFYKGVEGLATEIDAILRVPHGDAKAQRQSVLNLCQAYKVYTDCRVAAYVTCPGLYIPCSKLSEDLDVFMKGQCENAWRDSLATPLSDLDRTCHQAVDDAPI